MGRTAQSTKQSSAEILRLLGAESAAKGTSRLSARQIDRIIDAARFAKLSRRP